VGGFQQEGNSKFYEQKKGRDLRTTTEEAERKPRKGAVEELGGGGKGKSGRCRVERGSVAEENHKTHREGRSSKGVSRECKGTPKQRRREGGFR